MESNNAVFLTILAFSHLVEVLNNSEIVLIS